MSAIKIIGKLNPKQYSEMLDHLTRKKIKNPFIKAKDIVVDKKLEVEQREMFNRFNQANPRTEKAGGGMLVQPGFGGTRQGYAKSKNAAIRKPPTPEQEEIARNFYKKSWQQLTADQRKKIRTGHTTGYHIKSQIAEKTKKNILKLLNTKKNGKYVYRNIFLNGNYPSVDQLPKWITANQAGTAVHRIAELLNGRKVENFNFPLKVNKKAAKSIFKKFNSEAYGTPYSNAGKKIKYNLITDGIGNNYFPDKSTYSSFRQRAIKLLRDNGIDVDVLDLNELTGLSSAADNASFASSQFVNLMDSELNRVHHANLVKSYGQYEKRLQNVLKGKKPNFDEATKIVKEWRKWKNDWFNGRLDKDGGLPKKYRTQKLKSILPDFKLGSDAATKVFSNKRLNEFIEMDFPIVKEIKKAGYAKTFGTKKIMSETPILKEVVQGDKKVIEKLLLQKIGCPGFKAADGGRATFDVGTNCQIKGANLINSGMKNASSAQLKNFAAFANRTASLGRGVMKFGVIPEALYVSAETALRLGMGDNLNEAFLRATEYLRFGDQTKQAEMLEADRFFGPEIAGIIGKSIDYKNELAKVQSLEDQKANLQNLSVPGGDKFDYIGDLSQDIKNINAQIKQATDNLNNKFKMTDAERIYAERMKDEVDDARSAGSFFTKLKSRFRDAGQDIDDIETLGAPELSQEQLNQRMLPQAPTIYKVKDGKLITKNLSESSFDEIQDHVRLLKSVGVKDSSKRLLTERDTLRGMPLSQQEQIFGKEATYGFSGTMGEPINKPVFQKPQNVIGDIEKEIVGQTNVANPFDIDISDIGSGLRGFAAAGGGIAKEAGDRSGRPPERGPNSQGLLSLMKRGMKI